MQAILLFVLALNPAELTDEQLLTTARQAGSNGRRAEAAAAFAELARRAPTVSDRQAMVYGAAVNWRYAFEASHEHQHLCDGIEVLGTVESNVAEMVALAEWFASTAAGQGVVCKEKTQHQPVSLLELDGPIAGVEASGVEASGVDVPNRKLSGQDETADQHAGVRQAGGGRLKTAGIVLTTIGAAGAGALVVQAGVYAKRLEDYRQTPKFDAQQAHDLQRLEISMTVTGVSSGVALVAGITSLALHRYQRRLHVQPTIGGLTIRGRF